MPMELVLKVGDEVEVELVDYIPANEVKQQLNKNKGNMYEYKQVHERNRHRYQVGNWGSQTGEV